MNSFHLGGDIIVGLWMVFGISVIAWAVDDYRMSRPVGFVDMVCYTMIALLNLSLIVPGVIYFAWRIYS